MSRKATPDFAGEFAARRPSFNGAPLRAGQFLLTGMANPENNGLFEMQRGEMVRVFGYGEIPVEHQAKSSGALATPDRNHTCPACYGTGYMILDGWGAACCPRCAGTGERKANREPADHAFPRVRS